MRRRRLRAHQRIHDTLLDPCLHIQADGVRLLHGSGYLHDQLTSDSPRLYRAVNAPNPLRHDTAPLVHLLGMKIVRMMDEIELQTIHRVISQYLIDQPESLVAYLLMLEIRALVARPARIQIAGSPDVQMLVLEAKE